MEFKIQIDNEEFATYIKEATEAHLKTLARGTVEKYFKQVMEQKVENYDLTRMFKEAIDFRLSNAFFSLERSPLGQEVLKIMKEKVEKELPLYFKPTSIKTLINTTVTKHTKELMKTFIKDKE